MDLIKVQAKFTIHLTNFKRMVQDSIGMLLLYKWKQVEKENVVSLDSAMLPEITRIQKEGFGTGDRNGVRRYSKKMKKTFYVIMDHNKVVGYCIYYLKLIPSLKDFEKSSVIHSIAIDNNFRRKGLGENLLRESIKEMRLNKISSVILYVNIKNISAIHLYEKIGFRIIKEVKDVCGQDETCYKMKLELS